MQTESKERDEVSETADRERKSMEHKDDERKRKVER